MTGGTLIEWLTDTEMRIGNTEFHLMRLGTRRSTAQRFILLKNRQFIEGYVELAHSLKPRNVVELGIFAGGGTALFELLMQPEMLVAFDIDGERVAALDAFIQRRGAADRVHACYGVNQADGGTMVPILRHHFGTTELDLVVDDASHDLDLTRRSFNLLFPLLGEGGVYLVEDWGWGHFQFARERHGPSLAKLVLELTLSLPYSEDLIAEITVNRYWAVVRAGLRHDRRRGVRPLEPRQQPRPSTARHQRRGPRGYCGPDRLRGGSHLLTRRLLPPPPRDEFVAECTGVDRREAFCAHDRRDELVRSRADDGAVHDHIRRVLHDGADGYG